MEEIPQPLNTYIPRPRQERQRGPRLAREAPAPRTLKDFKVHAAHLRILWHLYNHGVLDTHQIGAMELEHKPLRAEYSPSYDPIQTVNSTLKYLYDYGLVERIASQQHWKYDPKLGGYRGTRPLVYCLTAQGAKLLRRCGFEINKERVKTLVGKFDLAFSTLPHELGIGAIYTMLNIAHTRVAKAAEASGKKPSFELLLWQEGRAIEETFTREGVKHRLRPDAAISLKFHDAPTGRDRFFNCFLEFDRATETVDDVMATKFKRYLAWQAVDGPYRRWGAKAMKVLTVTSTYGHLENLVRLATRLDPHGSLLWLACHRDCQDYRDPNNFLTKPIWRCPGASQAVSLAPPQASGDDPPPSPDR